MRKHQFFRIKGGKLERIGEGEGADEAHALELAKLAFEPDVIAVPSDRVFSLIEEESFWELAPVSSFESLMMTV